MFEESLKEVRVASSKKLILLKKDPLAYFLMSVLAGMYIGFGILIAFSVGGQITGGATKLVMGSVFSVALSLVIIVGAELFTGNNFVLSVGAMTKQNTWAQAVYLWGFCWIGNVCGSVLLAFLYKATGLQVDGIAKVITNAAIVKTTASPSELLARAILCNILVCLALWSSFRTKNDVAKLIMTFLCIVTFFTSGFEHSVANMTLLTAAMLGPDPISLGAWGYNIFWVTLGNMIGAIVFLAIPYILTLRKK